MLTCSWAHGLMIAGQPIFPSAMDGLTQSFIFKQKLQNCEPIDLSRFVADLRERHMECWTPYFDTHSREYNSKRSTYHQRCARPTKAKGSGHSFAWHPSQIHMSWPALWCHPQYSSLQTLCPHPTFWNSDMEPKTLPHMWPVWYWWYPRWAACPFPLHQSPRDFSPQEICAPLFPSTGAHDVSTFLSQNNNKLYLFLHELIAFYAG